jgi:hypothetical protein
MKCPPLWNPRFYCGVQGRQKLAPVLIIMSVSISAFSSPSPKKILNYPDSSKYNFLENA